MRPVHYPSDHLTTGPATAGRNATERTTSTMTTTELFDIYRDAYLAIREKYQHPDEPVLYLGKHYCETLPPKGWDHATHTAYSDEVTRLANWYRAAWRYAAKRRKTADDRAAYEQMCDRLAVAGHDLRFQGEPEPALF